MRIFQLTDTYSIVCDTKGNRSGFKHTAYLMRNGVEIDKKSIQYYNRTWEAYQYQTILREMIHTTKELTEEVKNTLIKQVA